MQAFPGISGIVYGTLSGLAAGIAYFLLLHEPGSLFYPFAALAFLGGPLIAGAIAAARSRERHRYRDFLLSGSAVFGVMLVLFIVMYAVLPQFDRTSVLLPESCTAISAGPLPGPAPSFVLSGNRTGVPVAENGQTAVVAVPGSTGPPYPCTVYIVSKSDNRILSSTVHPDNTIIAAIHDGTVFLYNDKLGYLIDARTGIPEKSILLIDNYGGLSDSDRPVLAGTSGNRSYLETSAVISSWSADGTVRSRTRLAMNAVAYNCFINGSTGEVVQINSPETLSF